MMNSQILPKERTVDSAMDAIDLMQKLQSKESMKRLRSKRVSTDGRVAYLDGELSFNSLCIPDGSKILIKTFSKAWFLWMIGFVILFYLLSISHDEISGWIAIFVSAFSVFIFDWVDKGLKEDRNEPIEKEIENLS